MSQLLAQSNQLNADRRAQLSEFDARMAQRSRTPLRLFRTRRPTGRSKLQILLIAATSLTLAILMPLPAGASEGGYLLNQANLGGALVKSMQASITPGPADVVAASNDLILHRVIMEFPITGGAGLIQIGVIKTSPDFRLDACGVSTVERDVVEWRAAVSGSNGYTCQYVEGHAPNTTKLFGVGKAAPQASCTGCYIAVLNGASTGPGLVHIGNSTNPADSSTFAGATSEARQYSTSQSSLATYGPVNGSGTNVQWSSDGYSGAVWHSMTPTLAYCYITDGHWYLSQPFAYEYAALRSVTNGASC